jgi:hypothetical protein
MAASTKQSFKREAFPSRTWERGLIYVMIGGTHHGHAWWAHQTVPVKLDDPSHPLCAAFGGKGFDVQDDIYYFTTPYSREDSHVLLSVDTAGAPKSMTDDRPDGD